MSDLNFSELAGFQPRQLEASTAVKDHTFLLYGGAAGGGKSYWLRWQCLRQLLYYYAKYRVKGVRIGLFCEDYPALKERHLSKIPFEFPSWLGSLNKSEHEFTLNPEYGSGVIAFRNLDDPSKYLSSEFASIAVDELTKNEKETFDFLNMRRRWPGIPDTRFFAATNPGEIGHAWVRKFWIDRDFTDENYDPTDFSFVQAKFTDNKYLPENYGKTLDSLPEKLRKAYKDGDWDVFAGQFFTEYSRAKHVVEPFEIPDGWMKIRGLDYGNTNPSCVLWGAIDYDGKLWIYRELWETGLTYTELAEKTLRMTSPEEEKKIDYTTADTSLFAKSPDTNKTGDQLMDDAGLHIEPANKERIFGANILREYLREGMIAFFSNCAQLTRTLPALIHDERNVEDVKKCDIDHAYDALRYMCTSLYEPSKVEKQSNLPPTQYVGDDDAPWSKEQKNISFNHMY